MFWDVKTPSYGTLGAACFDIYVYGSYDLHPGHTQIMSTGLKFEVPNGYVLLVYSRSGHGFKHNIRLANCVGVIDSDYRGELKVAITNDGMSKHFFESGTAIAQGMLLPVPSVRFELVEELSSTDRGTNGFGSTDKYATGGYLPGTWRGLSDVKSGRVHCDNPTLTNSPKETAHYSDNEVSNMVEAFKKHLDK